MTTDTPRPGYELLATVTLWRIAIAAAAWYGLHNVIGYRGGYDWAGLAELSQLGSLVVAVCYLGLAAYPIVVAGRRHEPRSAWLRGALAVMMALIGLTAIFILPNGGRLDHHGFYFEHLVTPLLVVADFVLVGRSQRFARWWYPLTWVSLPLAYFVFMLGNNPDEYGTMLSPQNPYFYLIVGGFFLGVLVIGYALLGLARLPRLADRPPVTPSAGFVVPQFVPRGAARPPAAIGDRPAFPPSSAPMPPANGSGPYTGPPSGPVSPARPEWPHV